MVVESMKCYQPRSKGDCNGILDGIPIGCCGHTAFRGTLGSTYYPLRTRINPWHGIVGFWIGRRKDLTTGRTKRKQLWTLMEPQDD